MKHSYHVESQAQQLSYQTMLFPKHNMNMNKVLTSVLLGNQERCGRLSAVVERMFNLSKALGKTPSTNIFTYLILPEDNPER
jgi:hypothetical protein